MLLKTKLLAIIPAVAAVSMLAALTPMHLGSQRLVETALETNGEALTRALNAAVAAKSDRAPAQGGGANIRPGLDEAFLARFAKEAGVELELYLPPGRAGAKGERAFASMDAAPLVAAADIASRLAARGAPVRATLADREYASFVFPLKDGAGRTVAAAHVLLPTAAYAEVSAGATWSAVLAGLLALLAATGAAYLFASRLVGAIEPVADLAVRLSRGEIDAKPLPLDRKDEIGVLARAMTTMRDGATEASRIRFALDGLSTMVMLADKDDRIVYFNQPLARMLQEAEAEIRKALPHFDAEKIIGANMADFHKKAEHQRKMVKGLKGPHPARITLGGKTFSLVISPVVSPEGARLGAVVEWRDVTAELRATDEIDAVVRAALEGDFTRRADLAGAPESLREMGERLNTVAETVDSGVAETSRVLRAMAKGDLTEKMNGAFKGVFGELQANVDRTATQLSQLISEISATTGAVHRNVGEITSGAEDLSARAEQQASSLEETAATMEEMSASVKANAESSGSARTLASDASDRAGSGGEIVRNAVSAMHAIESSSEKIADIVSVIDSIAFQTNLLALNAAVEAARAGDAGKGFAVVASEVRALAQRSSDAARDIRGLIETSAGQVSDGVRLVSRTGESLDGIVASIAQVEAAIQDIADASREQAAGVEEISSTISHMDEITQQNSSLAEQSASSARALSDGAQKLQSLIAAFKFHGAPAEVEAPAPAAPKKKIEAVEDAEWSKAEEKVVAPQTSPVSREPATVDNGSWAEF